MQKLGRCISDKEQQVQVLKFKPVLFFDFLVTSWVKHKNVKHKTTDHHNSHFQGCCTASPEVLLFLSLPWCSPLCVWVDWLFGAWAAASCRRWCGGSSSRPAGHQMWTKCALSSPSHRQGHPHPPTSAFSASYPSCQCLCSPAEGAGEQGGRWKTRPWWEVGGEEINSGTKKQTAYLEDVLM